MKKTLIALAALSVAGLASAQVTITGSVSAAYQSNLAKASGLAMTDNTIVVSASEDLGNGLKLDASWAIENGGARGAGFTRGDQSVALTTPIGVLAFKNVNSGGNQAAALVAPANLADDQFASQVIPNQAIDVLALSIPINEYFSLTGSYIESGNKDLPKATDAATAKAALAGASGGVTPAASTFVGAAKFTGYGLTVTGQAASSTYTDDAVTAMKILTNGKDVQTTSFDLSAIYDAGFAKLGVGYDSSRRGKTSDDKAAMLFGASVPLGSFTVGANYGTRDKANFLQVAAKYDLSKRTNANISWGQDNQGTKKADGSDSDTNSQYRISLNHSF